ncbi:hypothetical protein [Micromonospora sagamiensis]|uniref:Lipoprotein n=1 Tax=Micromonospora sagamiensis TaxID=47875 RepID=A0A562WD55_9ACTN|nr:hypothetical protein [Micromonospora sagamiensis]TWJ28220.1 hypothetical protein JD81_01723 [Micromonospora sagamiensis]BCL12889.1 hypothetical protein GCM10017556_06280 [Micromonospora sagamiensis]
MTRRPWLLWITLAAMAGGCATAEGGSGGQGLDRQRQQARDHLARYDRAVLDAGGGRRFVPVGNLTGQVGDWEPTNGDDKQALMSGRVSASNALPAVPHPTGQVVWDDGTTTSVPLLSAEEALHQMAATGAGGCPECVPLEVTGARLTTARIPTTRGPATAPIWEYTLNGTAVRATRVAVATSAMVTVEPPSWDSYDSPAGLPIESASTTTASRRLTVAFTGAPDAGNRPCGADYSAEAVESAHAVVVIVVGHPHAPDETCPGMGAPRTTTVDLEQPLGERAVLDVQQGLPVPLTVTG